MTMISKGSAICLCGCAALAARASAGAVAAQDGPASAGDERPDNSGLLDICHIDFVVASRDQALAGAEGGFGRAHRFDLQSPTARVPGGATGFELRVGF